MGLIHHTVNLANAADSDISSIEVEALVDSGAIDLLLPENMALQLKLRTLEKRIVTLADGRKREVDYAGPVLVEIFGRKAFCGAMVMGEQVLLGAVPMESMDVLIDPRSQQLIPNPQNPNIPGAMAVGVRNGK